MTAPPRSTSSPRPPPASLGPGMEGALHDLTNALAAARSYGELLLIRAETGVEETPIPLLQSLLKELERVGDIARSVRGGVVESYQPGDVLNCLECGYTFVHRKVGKMGSCRRCKSLEVERWKPS